MRTKGTTRDALSLLGLARRAGKVAGGTAAVRQAIREGRVALVIMAEDASRTQLDKVRSTIHNRTIPQVYLGDRNTLGAAVGLAPLSAVAVTHAELATKLAAELQEPVGGSGTDAVEA